MFLHSCARHSQAAPSACADDFFGVRARALRHTNLGSPVGTVPLLAVRVLYNLTCPAFDSGVCGGYTSNVGDQSHNTSVVPMTIAYILSV